MPLRPAVLLCCLLAPLAAAVGDRYALPAAAGAGDGRDWANAMAASGSALAAAWTAMPAGATLHLGSGTYPGLVLVLSGGGTAGAPKTLRGVDTGGGLPLITGSWVRTSPGTGADVITLARGLSHAVIQDLRLRAVRDAVKSWEGEHASLTLRGLAIEGVRNGIDLFGGTTATAAADCTRDLVIERCTITGFTKRGIRLRRGNHRVLIADCVADAGGREWATELFQIGFQIEGEQGVTGRAPLHDHDIRYERCIARRSYNDAGTGYWNGDGFCSEGGVANLRYVDCESTDHTDGGWDDKAVAPVYERCIARRNKRNFRVWGSGALFRHCVAADAVHPGGSGGAAGLWTNGSITVEDSDLFDNPATVALDRGTGAPAVLLRRCRLRRTAVTIPWWSNEDAPFISVEAPTWLAPGEGGTGSGNRSPAVGSAVAQPSLLVRP